PQTELNVIAVCFSPPSSLGSFSTSAPRDAIDLYDIQQAIFDASMLWIKFVNLSHVVHKKLY
ncbi:15131_t:CDS:1, partial [Dentiscutata heterogama]